MIPTPQTPRGQRGFAGSRFGAAQLPLGGGISSDSPRGGKTPLGVGDSHSGYETAGSVPAPAPHPPKPPQTPPGAAPGLSPRPHTFSHSARCSRGSGSGSGDAQGTRRRSSRCRRPPASWGNTSGPGPAAEPREGTRGWRGDTGMAGGQGMGSLITDFTGKDVGCWDGAVTP